MDGMWIVVDAAGQTAVLIHNLWCGFGKAGVAVVALRQHEGQKKCKFLYLPTRIPPGEKHYLDTLF
jgi:hypothetical protein